MSRDQARQRAKAIPAALRRLRIAAGHTSLRPAASAIEASTGQKVSRSSISKWESGQTVPQLDTALFFLEGLGWDFRTFQDAIDEEVAQDDPAAAVAAQIRNTPGLAAKIRAYLETTSESEPEAETAALLAHLEALDNEPQEDEGNGTDG